MKLLCDHMLGTLAAWLRCFGYDTLYASNDSTDDDLLDQAQKHHCLLLTRDKTLIQRSKKLGITTIPIPSDDLDTQLQIVLSHLPINNKDFFSRCLECNSLLEKVPKQQALPHVPENIQKTHDTFWFCPQCQKYYWHGSHYDNMKQKICSLLNSLD